MIYNDVHSSHHDTALEVSGKWSLLILLICLISKSEINSKMHIKMPDIKFAMTKLYM